MNIQQIQTKLSRLIKHKGKKLNSGEWVIGNLIDLEDGMLFIAESMEPEGIEKGAENYCLSIVYHAIDPDTLCVSLGERDQTGTLVFSNDILDGYMMNSAGHKRRPKTTYAQFEYRVHGSYSPKNGGSGIGGSTKKVITDIPNSYSYYPPIEHCKVVGNNFD